ncbi:FAD-binding oxidoreductase [Streptomyces kaniharaensis]|uniref:FAD-binding oxidoreductase n=1 Tax=Streptomyces kaniharaensis TaxID=212423 RepID=A0A6N7KVE6_9ACTN|nr:FAD-binding oxidoreductase [Streptomyces kaniharaensis]MQS15596.1 FAD-binding oxidoreductase [Streptomyces kaniharaensis]
MVDAGDCLGSDLPDPARPPGHAQAAGLDRRQLLRLAAAPVAAAALSACTGSGQPSGSSAPTSPATGSASRTGPAPASSVGASPTTAGPADWTALAHDVAGTVIRPQDSRYQDAVRLYQPQFDNLRPAGVVYPANAQDVATCLAFARKYTVPVALRSGGHSYTGWSSGSGLILDVGGLATVSGSGGSATVGAGARLIDVYAELAATGVTVPAGSCPSVGVAGLALGGGIGVTCRAYGLTSDNLTSAQVVTADGLIRQVDATTDADLFWALRGGGGGNFGVVTSFGFRTHPAVNCAYGFLSWPWSSAAAVVAAWQAWAPDAPDQLWANLHLDAQPDGRPNLTSTVNFLGSQAELADLIDKLAVAPATASLHSAPYLDTMKAMGGVAGWSLAAAHLPGSLPGHTPEGRLIRESYAARSDFYDRPISATGIAALVASVERYARTAPQGAGASVAFDALAGAVNRVAPGDTAFVHRNALFMAQYIANYPSPGAGSGPAVDQSRAWLQDVWSTMRPYASGEAYQNYPDPQLADWAQAYYGSNLARLRQVKQTYDPAGLFRFPQDVSRA